jgi:disulfide bond formation protein DsbB
MGERGVVLGLTAASAAALALALTVQHGFGYPPCSLCVQARLPHWIILGIGPLALYCRRYRLGLGLIVMALVVAFTISLRHVGVEAGWLPLPNSCAIDPLASPTGDLRSALMAQTQPSCDQPGPAFLGASMAAWHAGVALSLAFIGALTLSRGRARA